MTNPRQATVNVKLISVDLTSRTGEFVLAPVGSDPLPPPNGAHQVLTFENKHHDGVDIDFVLTDTTGEDYAFPPNNLKAQAVSSQLGATDLCPPQGMSQVLSPINIGGPNNNTLRVHNPNQDKHPTGPNLTGPFSYVLWVTKDNGANWIALDPGGQNMNGSTRRFPSTAAIVATAVVAAVAAFTLFKLHVFRT